MIKKESRNSMRVARHERIRKNIFGTSATPRLCVFRSNTGIYAQIIDDENKTTLVSASSLDKDLKLKNGSNVEAAKVVGKSIAEKAVIAVQNFKNYMLVKHGNTVERNFVAIRANLKNNYFITLFSFT